MKDIASEGIDKFFLKFKQRNYKKGQVILHPDEEASDHIYYLEKGHVKVYSITEEGNERCHIFYKPGEIFPLVAFFVNKTRDVFFEAMEGITVRRAPRKEFMDFIMTDTKYLLEIIKRISVVLEIYANRIDNLECTNAYPRVISRLIYMAERFGRRYGKNIILDIPVTHKDIANTIGLTRETASREIEVLIKKGMISQNGHIIVINNIKKLKKELELALGLFLLYAAF